MKRRKQGLTLHRETLHRLGERELRPIAGGDTNPPGSSCVNTWGDCSERCFIEPNSVYYCSVYNC